VFDITQSIVTDVNFTEAFPYDTATYVGVDSQRGHRHHDRLQRRSGSAVDVRAHIGVGGLVRYHTRPVDLTRNGRTISVDAGDASGCAGSDSLSDTCR
jgi:hypothetical protein